MVNPMSSNDPTPDEYTALAEFLGGFPEDVQADAEEQSVFELLQDARWDLSQAAELQGIKGAEIAARLGISPSAVSRMVNNTGDVRASTLVLWARSVNRKIKILVYSSSNVSKNIISNFEVKAYDRSAPITSTPPSFLKEIGNVPVQLVRELST